MACFPNAHAAYHLMTGPDRDSAASSDEAAALQAKLAFLADPASYPGGAKGLRAIETHMSWVVLAGDLAYKLKKPVRLPYLDFSSTEAHRLDCEEEVRLNRRLERDIYLGVEPLTRMPDGALALGGEGPALNWIVKMRRLPTEAMLDRCIARGAVAPERVRQLAAVLARFHAEAPHRHLAARGLCPEAGPGGAGKRRRALVGPSWPAARAHPRRPGRPDFLSRPARGPASGARRPGPGGGRPWRSAAGTHLPRPRPAGHRLRRVQPRVPPPRRAGRARFPRPGVRAPGRCRPGRAPAGGLHRRARRCGRSRAGELLQEPLGLPPGKDRRLAPHRPIRDGPRQVARPHRGIHRPGGEVRRPSISLAWISCSRAR